MDRNNIHQWISRLGQFHDVLQKTGVITDQPLIELFPGIDEVFLVPESGLELVFWAETKRYESLFITLIKTTPSTIEYKGELPPPYTKNMIKSDVRTIFGEPTESSGPITMPDPVGKIGGWDCYHLDSIAFPNKKVFFSYTRDLKVDSLSFTLIDKDHD